MLFHTLFYNFKLTNVNNLIILRFFKQQLNKLIVQMLLIVINFCLFPWNNF